MEEFMLLRIKSDNDSTFGALFHGDSFVCATMEDQYQPIKEHAETRIPAGRYQLELRIEGGFHKRYQQHRKIGPIHKGMIWLRMPDSPAGNDEVSRVNDNGDIETWTYVLLHCGNTDDDTAGCILVGRFPQAFLGKMEIWSSVNTYLSIYPRMAKMIQKGDVFLTIKDLDR